MAEKGIVTGLLMPKATAVWLVENTALTFSQIGDFTGLHEIEVQALADEEVGRGIVGRNPIENNEITPEELTKAEKDPSYRMRLIKTDLPSIKLRAKGPRYTPVSKRQDKPDGIAWIIRNHPEVSDGQIGKLIGTTRNTIQAIRDRTHWNIVDIVPKDPVTLGLCTQRELDAVVKKAAKLKGIEAQADGKLEGDRAALIEELRHERDAAARAAEAAAEGVEVTVAPVEHNAETLFKR